MRCTNPACMAIATPRERPQLKSPGPSTGPLVENARSTSPTRRTAVSPRSIEPRRVSARSSLPLHGRRNYGSPPLGRDGLRQVMRAAPAALPRQGLIRGLVTAQKERRVLRPKAAWTLVQVLGIARPAMYLSFGEFRSSDFQGGARTRRSRINRIRRRRKRDGRTTARRFTHPASI